MHMFDSWAVDPFVNNRFYKCLFGGGAQIEINGIYGPNFREPLLRPTDKARTGGIWVLRNSGKISAALIGSSIIS